MENLTKEELFSHVDESIKKNIEEIAGPKLAEKAAEIVAQARAQDVINGKASLGNSEKEQLATDFKRIASGEKAAYLTVNDQTGGYLVPIEVNSEIMRIAATTGHIARDAHRFPIADIDLPIYTGSVMQGEFVGEDEAPSETQNDIGVARLRSADWRTIIRVSNRLISKANVNVAEWLMALVAEGLAYRMDREGFVGGTFAGSPFVGLMSDASGATVQTLGSGKDTIEEFDPIEASIAIGTVANSALGKAGFYFHRTVWAVLRAQKDGTSGEYVYRQDHSTFTSLQRESGIQPVGSIWGYPVYTTDVLPAYSSAATGVKFGIFGNLNLALALGEDGPMEMARSENAVVGGVSTFERNQTAFRFNKRFAVAPMLPAAAVILKTA